MPPAYARAASLGQACQAYEKVPKEKGTHKTEHIKVNFRLHILKRIYTAASSSGHLPPLHTTAHYKSLVGAWCSKIKGCLLDCMPTQAGGRCLEACFEFSFKNTPHTSNMKT